MRGKIGAMLTGWGELRVSGQHPLRTGLLIVTFAILASGAIVAPFSAQTKRLPKVQSGLLIDVIHRSVMEHFDEMLRSGDFYPRWLSDINYGYGNAGPIFTSQASIFDLWLMPSQITGSTRCFITALGLVGQDWLSHSRASFGKLASAVAASAYSLLPITY
jgi:hypothetical protein